MSGKHETCKWAKFDEQLGEYKCKLFYIRLKPTKCESCKNHSESQKFTSGLPVRLSVNE